MRKNDDKIPQDGSWVTWQLSSVLYHHLPQLGESDKHVDLPGPLRISPDRETVLSCPGAPGTQGWGRVLLLWVAVGLWEAHCRWL